MRSEEPTATGEVPCLEPVAGVYQLIVESHSMLRGHRTNCFVIGQSGAQAIIVDPSPKDDEEYEKLVRTLERLSHEHSYRYKGIFITHGHGDHYMNSPRLARQLSLPFFISQYTRQRLTTKERKNRMTDLDIQISGEGDILTRWQGKEVKVFHVPGHDEGHLALAPEDMSWFLAGDLIQQKGTVVIPAREGDMAKYFATLERIINLNPKLVLPSHGQATKGVSVLKKTLKHRTKREQQVLKLHRKGFTPQQMVELIYRNVDKRLRPLALENIKSHLKKLFP